MTQPLTMGAPPQEGWDLPDHPFAILPGQFRLQGFSTLDDLARFIHRERRGRGLRLSEAGCSYAGCETFIGVQVRWLVGDDEQFAFAVGFRAAEVEGAHRAALEAALAHTSPQTARRRAAA